MADARITDLETIKQVFDKFEVRLFVVYGAVLGIHRDGKLIDHDDDIDLAVIDNVDFKTRKAIGWMLFDLGFKPQQEMAFNVFGRFEHGEEVGYTGTEESGIIVCQRSFKFTVFFFKLEECDEHGFEYVCIPKQGAIKLIATPAKFFSIPGEIKIGKNKYLCPSPMEGYLEFCYLNWKDREGRDHSPTYPTAHPKYIYGTT